MQKYLLVILVFVFACQCQTASPISEDYDSMSSFDYYTHYAYSSMYSAISQVQNTVTYATQGPQTVVSTPVASDNEDNETDNEGNEECEGIVLDLTTDSQVKLGEVTLNYNGDLIVNIETTTVTDLLDRVTILLSTSLAVNANANLINEYQIELEAINQNTFSGRIPINAPCGVVLNIAIEADILQSGSTLVSTSTVSVDQQLSGNVNLLAELQLSCDCLIDDVTEQVDSILGNIGLFGHQSQVSATATAKKSAKRTATVQSTPFAVSDNSTWVVFGVSTAFVALIAGFVGFVAIKRTRKQRQFVSPIPPEFDEV